MPGPPQSSSLLWASLAILGLILLIARLKLHAFLALTLVSLLAGLGAGMDPSRIAQTFQEGVGAMLGSVAAVIGLGMILGRMLTESGGGEVVAHTLMGAFGTQRLPWALLVIGFLVGIPVFFAVGLVLLVPILLTVLHDTKAPLLRLGIPLLAGLSVVHGLVPPHPGPMAAIELTKAEAGRVLFYSLIVGLPTALIAGPVFGSFVAARVPTLSPEPGARGTSRADPSCRPSFGLTLFTIVLPVALMLAATLGSLVLRSGSQLRAVLGFLGNPLSAMLAATLFASYSLGLRRGFTRQDLLRFAEESLAPAASILLVVGAGGGFNRVLVAMGAGDALAEWAQSTHLSPILLGWLVAASIRVATGSATVAITTAAGIVTPLAKAIPGTNLELLVLSMGAGSLALSHVNDGGFWLVKEYFGLTVEQTLKSWTVMETIISVVALAFVWILSVFV